MKKFLAVLLCLILTLSAVSCGEDTNWIAKKDGETVPAGIYLYYLITAKSEAQSKIDKDADLFKSQVEGKDAETWIKDRALELVKQHVAVEDVFEENKLKLSQDDTDYLDYYAEYMWYYLEQNYLDSGISKASMTEVLYNTSKYEAVFEYLYGKDGPKAIPQEELDKYFTENAARIHAITFSIVDKDNKTLTGDALKEVEDKANSYYERLKNGEDILVLADEYHASLEETTEETTSSEETTDTEPDPNRHQAIIIKSNSSLKEENTKKLFELKYGENVMFTDASQIVIAVRLDMLEDKDACENYTPTAMSELKGEEYEEYVKELTSKVELEVNEKAVNRYSPKKVKVF